MIKNTFLSMTVMLCAGMMFSSLDAMGKEIRKREEAKLAPTRAAGRAAQAAAAEAEERQLRAAAAAAAAKAKPSTPAPSRTTALLVTNLLQEGLMASSKYSAVIDGYKITVMNSSAAKTPLVGRTTKVSAVTAYPTPKKGVTLPASKIKVGDEVIYNSAQDKTFIGTMYVLQGKAPSGTKNGNNFFNLKPGN